MLSIDSFHVSKLQVKSYQLVSLKNKNWQLFEQVYVWIKICTAGLDCQ